MESIRGGDAVSVIEQMEQEAEKDKNFYFKVMYNEEDSRLVALFWCDSIMRDDFKVFGDVVIFDTTYRTNKYNLICAPIVGINNHWRNVMFACAFIADEKIESFEWVLTNLKKAMLNKCPQTIFTDQDHAITKAIEKVRNTNQ